QIEVLEKVIKRQLPESFKIFLKIINGQKNDNFYFLPDQSLLFSSDEIINEYKAQSECFEDCLEFYNDFQCVEKVRCTVFSETRIPIAGRDGYYLFLDFDPGPNGSVGQIIYLVNECDFVVLAPSFDKFIDNYNFLILNNDFKIQNFGNYYRLTNESNFLDGLDFENLFKVI
ncbi:MAG: SMI1/KNR4 family protein, partial [Fluviicola sp.]